MTSDAQKRANRKWREKNRERHNEMIIAWNTKNADKIREYNRVFNARKRAYKAAVKELFNCLV
jgi:hypothetical protein